MDLEARKYNFIQELFKIKKESVMDILERVLKSEKEESQDVLNAHKNELENRLKDFKNNPNDLLDWKDVENQW